MAEANPPPHLRVPTGLAEIPGASEYFKSSEFNMFQLWVRTGSGQDNFELIIDSIEEILIRLLIIEGQIVVIQARLALIELRLDAIEARLTYLEGALSVTAVDLTTSGNQTVICTAEVTITLSANPLDKDVVRVKQTDFRIVIDGNGRNIDGNSSIKVRKQSNKIKTGLDFIYSSDLNAWFVI